MEEEEAFEGDDWKDEHVEEEEEKEEITKKAKHKPSADDDERSETGSSDKGSEDDAEIIEEKELVIDEKELGSDESLEFKEVKDTSDLEKHRILKRKYEFIFNVFKIEQTETVYVNPLTYFNSADPKANHLLNVTFVDRYGSKIKSDYALKDKVVVALFFSNRNCGRGNKLLPILKKIHKKAEECKKHFEIVYVCFDYTKEEMMADLRLNHGNWFAIDFDDPTRDILRIVYSILALPQLIVVDEYGEMITRTGIVEVEAIGMNVLVTWF